MSLLVFGILWFCGGCRGRGLGRGLCFGSPGFTSTIKTDISHPYIVWSRGYIYHFHFNVWLLVWFGGGYGGVAVRNYNDTGGWCGVHRGFVGVWELKLFRKVSFGLALVQVFLHQFGVADDVLVFWQHVILKYAVDVLEGVLKEHEVRHAVLAVFLSDYDWVMFRW